MGFFLFISTSHGQTKPIELTYANITPGTHKLSLSFVEWAKEVDKRTNGKVKVTVFSSSTLSPPDKCYDGVIKGISDIGMSVFAYTRGKFPLTEVIDLPLGYKSGVAATRLINEYYQKFKPKELDEVKVMYLFAHGPGILHTRKNPVNKLEDLKGLKIRSTGLGAKVVSALGGAPVAMPMLETYDSLSKGIVEGSLAPIESLEGYKWGEVIKYSTESYGSAYTSGMFVVMNKEKWNALPSDVQKVIEKINEEWVEKTGKLWDEMDKSGREFTLKLGNKILPLSSEENERWAKAVKPLTDEYVNLMKTKGLPGEDVLNFCLGRLKQLQ
jgi:TRAP-type C4-dicarboxylate transport system substrate-binding protein